MPESVQDRPTKASEMLFLLSKSERYFYDIEATRVFSNRLNRGTGADELRLERSFAAPRSFAAERGKVPLDHQWAPYLILATLLGAKRVFVKERNDLLGQVFDIFKHPENARIGWSVLAGATHNAANVLFHVMKHIGIVIAELNTDAESELWVRGLAISDTVEYNDRSFPVKQAREVIAKIIANAQVLRNTIPIDTLAERAIDVDMVENAIPFLDCIDLGTSQCGDGLITEALIKQLNLALRGIGLDKASGPRHNTPPDDVALSTVHYNTKEQTNQGRNLWDWWIVNTAPFSGAHFAVMPEKLIEPCIKAGSAAGDTVLDPFGGSGTVGRVAERLGRDAVLIELNAAYIDLQEKRLDGIQVELFT